MQALLLTGYGGIEKYKLQRIPIPEPKADEVLVRISAIALNNTDINTRKGAYGDSSDDGSQTSWDGSTLSFPWIQGCDACGYIVKLGANHPSDTTWNRLRVGQRVLINPIINKRNRWGEEFLDKYLGSELPGTYAEYVCAPMANVFAVDSALKDHELCSFLCAYITPFVEMNAFSFPVRRAASAARWRSCCSIWTALPSSSSETRKRHALCAADWAQS